MPSPHSSSDRVLLARRCSSQLLTGEPASDVVGVVDRLLAVQAQDARGARLAIRPRSTGVVASDVDHALTVDRSLIITWLNRGTLHLVRSDDYWWLLELTTPQLVTSNARRLVQEGVSREQAERGVRVIDAALTSDGPMTREALRERLVAHDIPVARQALVHLLGLASLRGLIVRGPMIDGEQAFVLVRDWLGAPPNERPREQLLGELARRYLVGHGPATEADLAKWAGITLGNARLGFAQVADELDVDIHGNASLRGTSVDSSAAKAPLPLPRLLGPFDPLLMGWRSRDFVLPVDGGVVTTNGIFRAVALVNGIGVATWSLAAGRITLGEPFGPMSATDRAHLEADAQEVLAFMGSAVGEPASAG
jgi:hypothetical protein